MNSLSALLSKKLEKRKDSGALRFLTPNGFSTDFYSNDYLGLAQRNTPFSNALHSGTGSRLISGTASICLETEHFLAQTWKSEAALVFNSGYDANLGLISTVADRNTTVIYDEHIHASARDGILLSKSKSLKFRHNDLEHLKGILSKTKGVCIVLVESIYSMHGDFCDLIACAEICNAFGAHLIVDEAHAGGIFGISGGGRVQELGLEEMVFARLITFGKGLGSHGACILGSQLLIDSLINFARSFIYTTALPSAAFERIQTLIKSVNFKDLQIKLQQNIQLFCTSKANYASPIQIWTPENSADLKQKEQRIKAHKIGIKAIYPPTVKIGEERLRICIHAFNTREEIVRLKQLLN